MPFKGRNSAYEDITTLNYHLNVDDFCILIAPITLELYIEINKGRFVFEGEQVAIEGEDNVVYEPLCARCYFKYKKEYEKQKRGHAYPESVIKNQRFPNLQ